VATSLYSTAAIVAGTAFGQPESGIRPATGAFAAYDAFVLVDAGTIYLQSPDKLSH
jgi:hypothetical protein